MTTINQNIEQALNRRYATKVFDSSKKISEQDFATIQQSLRLAPSSYGIQPWAFVWVQDKAKRELMKAASYGQPQVTDADRLLIIAVKTDTKAAIKTYVDGMVSATGKSAADFAEYKASMDGSAERSDLSWSRRQTYIALGFALQTAALLGVDACPMEGFDPAAVDKILGLTELGLASSVMLTLGYGVEGGSPNQHHKFRFETNDVNIIL
jgi:nitroreductase